MAGIIGREHAREPVIGGVVDGQARLQAGEPVVGSHEDIDGAPELIGFRHIFGVVHDRVNAARQRQRHIERLRFGTWPDRRRHDDFEWRPEIEPGKACLVSSSSASSTNFTSSFSIG